MNRIALATAVVFAALPFAACAQAPVALSTPAGVIGTFDRTSIVLAYYRSPLWSAILADRRFELETVKAAKDEARVKELEKYGGESQDLAMKQLAGKAPIDNIVVVLRPEFKELTTRMKLSGVVEASAANPKAATVDVTAQLLDWLNAGAETRKMAADLVAQKPPAK
ncbi:MAG: hypothetical protein ABR987_12440 [Terracidiphilus sp.]|jgi:hypothetical protein